MAFRIRTEGVDVDGRRAIAPHALNWVDGALPRAGRTAFWHSFSF